MLHILSKHHLRVSLKLRWRERPLCCDVNVVRDCMKSSVQVAQRHTVTKGSAVALPPEDVGKGVLPMDLSGPHPIPFSGHRYFLVANLSTPEGDDIPFSRLLKTKTTEEVARALTSVMCQIVFACSGSAASFPYPFRCWERVHWGIIPERG